MYPHGVTSHAMTRARGAAVGEDGRGRNSLHQGRPTAAIGQVKRVLVVFSLYLCRFQLPVASSRVRPLLKTKGLFVP